MTITLNFTHSYQQNNHKQLVQPHTATTTSITTTSTISSFSPTQQMKDAADKRRELERQHAEALAQLREQQAALSGTDKNRKASVEVVEALQVCTPLEFIVVSLSWAQIRFH